MIWKRETSSREYGPRSIGTKNSVRSLGKLLANTDRRCSSKISRVIKNTLCRRLFTNGTGTKKRLCWILGVAENTHDRDIVRVFKERFANPVKPVTVSKGPVKENIVKGDGVDLYQLPVPKWNPLDGGRYIMTSGSVVTRDPDSGTLNVGTYRGMIGSKNTIGVLLATTQGWGMHFVKHRSRNEAMPVAVVLGWDQALFIAASTPVIYPEYDMAGSLRRAPVELVKCETNDLMVPASAEIVLEGFVSPDPETFTLEGPFSEYPGLLRRHQIAQAYDQSHLYHLSQRSDLSRLFDRRQSGSHQRVQHLDAGDFLGDGLAYARTSRRRQYHRCMARQVARDAAHSNSQIAPRPRPAGGDRAVGQPSRQLRRQACDRRR